jgi:hypothetical protein
MPHVFISYVHENNRKVARLVSSLKDNGIEVWLDKEQLNPGQRWRDAIRAAIRGGSFFIACFSKEYVKKESTFMNDEVSVAIEELRLRPTSRSWFIPVLLPGGEVPDRAIGGGETLRDLQWVSLEDEARWDEGISTIVRTIKTGIDAGDKSVPSSRPKHPRSAASVRRAKTKPFSLKTCFVCDGEGKVPHHQYSASVGIGPVDGYVQCETCKGTGRVPSSFRNGFLGLRVLTDCWNCGRTGIAYNSIYTHCPSCGVDLYPT